MVGLLDTNRTLQSIATLSVMCVSTVLAACSGSDSALRSQQREENDAEVVIVEFGDYGCGPCSRFGRRLHQVLRQSDREIRMIFRHCPSRQHPFGRRASEVAASTASDEDFWRLHWLLVQEGPITSEEQIWQAVEDAGIDAAALRSRVDAGVGRRIVDRDVALADELGLRGVPTTFINGRRLDGAVSREQLRATIHLALE